MLRISLLVAIGVMASAVGCAQCDTCDDFPAPCVGPNCGGNTYSPPGYLAPTMDQGAPMQGPGSGPAASGPSDDGVPSTSGPASPATPSPSVPPADAAPVTSPPMPTDPIGRPGL